MKYTTSVIARFILAILFFSGCDGYKINIFVDNNRNPSSTSSRTEPGEGPKTEPGEGPRVVAGGCNNTNYMPINNTAGLKNIKANLGDDYCLTKDITLTEDWEPLGAFTGKLDGQQHTITRLTISKSNDDEVGLFSSIGTNTNLTGLVKDLTIEGAVITGKDKVGALAGKSYGRIENVHVKNVTITAANVAGGLIGYASRTITKSSAHGNINEGSLASTNAENIGGLVGELGPNGIITNSNTEVNVEGLTSIGGLVGVLDGQIESSHATGTVKGASSSIGGLVGFSSRTIKDSTASGDVSGSNNNTSGGLVGKLEYSGQEIAIENSSATGNVTGTYTLGGLVGSLAQGEITGSYATGNVKGTGNQIGGLVGSSSGTIKQSYATGDVSSSTVNGTPENIGGLVGLVNAGTIQDSHYKPTNTSNTAGNVVGHHDIGGLVGRLQGTILRSYAEGINIQSGNNDIGGLVGTAKAGSSIEQSYTTGKITIDLSISSADNIGGLVGVLEGNINQSYSDVNLTGRNYVGGLVGFSQQSQTATTPNDPEITDSYATGSVTGDSNIGGLIGLAGNTSITNSYYYYTNTDAANTDAANKGISERGAAQNVGDTLGLLVGSETANLTITNCYWSNSTSLNAVGNNFTGTLQGLGLPTPPLDTSFISWEPAIWDFVTRKNDWPTLQWQP